MVVLVLEIESPAAQDSFNYIQSSRTECWDAGTAEGSLAACFVLLWETFCCCCSFVLFETACCIASSQWLQTCEPLASPCLPGARIACRCATSFLEAGLPPSLPLQEKCGALELDLRKTSAVMMLGTVPFPPPL